MDLSKSSKNGKRRCSPQQKSQKRIVYEEVVISSSDEEEEDDLQIVYEMKVDKPQSERSEINNSKSISQSTHKLYQQIQQTPPIPNPASISQKLTRSSSKQDIHCTESKSNNKTRDSNNDGKSHYETCIKVECEPREITKYGIDSQSSVENCEIFNYKDMNMDKNDEYICQPSESQNDVKSGLERDTNKNNQIFVASMDVEYNHVLTANDEEIDTDKKSTKSSDSDATEKITEASVIEEATVMESDDTEAEAESNHGLEDMSYESKVSLISTDEEDLSEFSDKESSKAWGLRNSRKANNTRPKIRNGHRNISPKSEKTFLKFFSKNQWPTRKQTTALASKAKLLISTVYRWFAKTRLGTQRVRRPSRKIPQQKIRFSTQQRTILSNAYDRDQYPKHEEKERLAEECDLSFTQVQTWFLQRRYTAGNACKTRILKLKMRSDNSDNCSFVDTSERDPQMPVLELQVPLQSTEMTVEETDWEKSRNKKANIVRNSHQKNPPTKTRQLEHKKVTVAERQEEILLKFFETTTTNPIPAEKQELSKETALSIDLISEWFERKLEETRDQAEQLNDYQEVEEVEEFSDDDPTEKNCENPKLTSDEEFSEDGAVEESCKDSKSTSDEEFSEDGAVEESYTDSLKTTNEEGDFENHIQETLNRLTELPQATLSAMWAKNEKIFFKLMELYTEDADISSKLQKDSEYIKELLDYYNWAFNDEQTSVIANLNANFVEDNRQEIWDLIDEQETDDFTNEILNPWSTILLYRAISKHNIAHIVFDLAKDEEKQMAHQWTIPSLLDQVIAGGYNQ